MFDTVSLPAGGGSRSESYSLFVENAAREWARECGVQVVGQLRHRVADGRFGAETVQPLQSRQ